MLEEYKSIIVIIIIIIIIIFCEKWERERGIEDNNVGVFLSM